MKIKLEIGKVPKEILYKILQKLNETFGILAEPSMFVHPMTLKKYVKELCGIGKNNVGEMPVASIDEEMLKIFPFYKTTVK